METKHNLFAIDEEQGVEHDDAEAQMLSVLMNDTSTNHSNDFSLTQQFNFNKGVKVFGMKGKEETVTKLSRREQERAQEASLHPA